MSKYFVPQLNEFRCCRKVEAGTDYRKITLQDAYTGELFIIQPGLDKFHRARMVCIDHSENKMGTFMVQFDVHDASTTGEIDANHFGKMPYIESI